MTMMKYTMKIKLDQTYFDDNKLLFEKLMYIFEKSATNHAQEIGLGFEEMVSKNLYWVLLRLKLDIIEMPLINQNVIIETWPLPKGRIDFDRDFSIKSEKGDLLVKASSKWCLIDCERRMIQRSDKIDYNGELMDVRNYNEKFEKISLPEDKKQEFLCNYKVSDIDIDDNRHMNNTSYAKIAKEVINNSNYKHFEINFIKECFLDDILQLFSIMDNDQQYIVGKVNENISFIIYLR